MAFRGQVLEGVDLRTGKKLVYREGQARGEGVEDPKFTGFRIVYGDGVGEYVSVNVAREDNGGILVGMGQGILIEPIGGDLVKLTPDTRKMYSHQ